MAQNVTLTRNVTTFVKHNVTLTRNVKTLNAKCNNVLPRNEASFKRKL